MFHRSARLMPVGWLKAAVLTVVLVMYGRATIVEGHSYHTQHWTTEHGLPQNSARALAQTQDGYLWIGTLSGLARFDGVRFTIFDRVNTPEMVTDAINELLVDKDGTLWVGTRDGLLEWRGRMVKRWSTADGLPGKSRQIIGEMFERPAGGLWFREGIHACLLHDGSVKTYRAAEGLVTNEVRQIARTRDGQLLVLTLPGLQRLQANGRFGALVGWPLPAKWSHLVEAGNGEVWIGGEAGCFRLSAQDWAEALNRSSNSLPRDSQENAALFTPAWKRAGPAEGLSAVAHVELFADRHGVVWSSTRVEGLQRWDGMRFQRVALEEFKQADVTSLLEDREGNVWAGTSRNGLFRLRPKRIRSWTTRDGLPDERVKPLGVAVDGSVWAGTEAGVARIFQGKIETFPAILPAMRVDRLGVVRNEIWAVVQGHAVFRMDGTSGGIVSNLPFPWISSVYEDRKGRVWFADREAAVFQEGRWTKPFPGFTFDGPVRAMLEDRSGVMWFGTSSAGLYRIKDGQTARFTEADGLCDESPTALYEDADGAIWIGSNGGLNRYKDGKLARIRVEEGLRENTVNQILEDDFGDFWVSGLRGVHRVSRTDLNAVADGRSRRVQCLTYGEVDGMARSETNGDFQPAGCKTPDGHLWFPTDMGVVEVDPALMRESEREVPISIEQVLAKDKAVFLKPDASPLTLAPGTGRFLEIRFTATSFLAPEKVRFQYKLEPIDTEWRESGSQRLAFFHDLRPGRYTFAVRACNPHGLWNERPDRLTFVVEPQFWQTRSFYALCGAAVVIVAAGFTAYRLRWQQRLLDARHEQALAEERARIARDLHDDLGTALTGVALEIDLARRQSSDGIAMRLGESASRVRVLAERMREVVWAVNPRCDTVSSLASFLEQQAGALLHAGGVRGRFEFPENIPVLPLDSETRHQLALGVREALTNVLRHAQAGEVIVALALNEETLTVSVRDDGRGFDVARTGTESGHGLHNLRSRLERVGGVAVIESSPGGGTRVELRVPMRTVK